MIKAVIFDCFGVLTVDTWRELYADYPADQKLAVDDLTKAFDTGILSREDLSHRASEILGVDEQVVNEASLPKSKKNQDLLDYIAQLKGRGLKIGLLSNVSDNWIRDSFLTESEQQLFDEMVMSFEVGLSKPDSRIYEYLLRKLGVEAEETIFIDDLLPYCEAAASLGIKSIQYQHFSQTKDDIEAHLEYENKSLSQN